MKKLTNKGFGTLHTLLIVVVLAAIAAVGYIVYKANNKPAENNKKSITSFEECVAAGNPIMESYPEQCAADGKTFSNPAQKVEPPKTEAKKYLEIKELGVKFEHIAGLEDLYYYHPEGASWVYFSLNSLKDTDCAADKIAQVALGKYTQAEAEEDPAAEGILKSQKIGDYYYMAQGGQANCSDDEAVQAKADKLRKDVVTAVNKGLITL